MRCVYIIKNKCLAFVANRKTIRVHFDLLTLDGVLAFLALEAFWMPLGVLGDGSRTVDDLFATLALIGDVGVEALLANRSSLSLHVALPDQLLLAEVAHEMVLVPGLVHALDNLLPDDLVAAVAFGQHILVILHAQRLTILLLKFGLGDGLLAFVADEMHGMVGFT